MDPLKAYGPSYKPKTRGDLVIHAESEIVCFDPLPLTNPDATEYTFDMVGYPVDASGNLLKATGEGSTAGLIATPGMLKIGASEVTKPVAVLVRGPAAINREAIATTDIAGGGFTVASIVTALEALGIVVRDEPVKSSVQTN